MAGLRRWWSKKYNLPPYHELFTSRSVDELNQEMIEDLLLQRQDIKEELEDRDDGKKRKSRRDLLWDQLNRINKALGLEVIPQDRLWDFWEGQLARGETPDLDMTMADLEALRASGDWRAA